VTPVVDPEPCTFLTSVLLFFSKTMCAGHPPLLFPEAHHGRQRRPPRGPTP
jgi:hypothetical protein